MIDQRHPTPFLTALVAVMLEPYNDLLGRLFEDGRLERSELRALRTAVRARLDDLAPLVELELGRARLEAQSPEWPESLPPCEVDALPSHETA